MRAMAFGLLPAFVCFLFVFKLKEIWKNKKVYHILLLILPQ